MENTIHGSGKRDNFPESDGGEAIRQRLYFVADAKGSGFAEQHQHNGEQEAGVGAVERRRYVGGCGIVGDPYRTRTSNGELQRSGELGWTAETDGASATGIMGHPSQRGLGVNGRAPRDTGHPDEPEQAEFMGNAEQPGPQGRERSGNVELHRAAGSDGPIATAGIFNELEFASGERRATNGFWSNAEWIACRDGKARPVEPGSPPLVTGAAARVVRLRGYGNSINAPQAAAFIEAYMSATR